MNFERPAEKPPSYVPQKGLDDIIAELKEAKLSPDQKKELVESAFKEIRSVFESSGGEYKEDINELYGALKGKDLLVRRHHPQGVIEAIRSHEDIELAFDRSVAEEYANAAEWKYEDGPRGLKNAFLEGWTKLGPMSVVLLFKKGADLEVRDIKDNMKVIGDIERGKVRIAKGRIHPEDIEGVVISTPAGYFPEGEMTESEHERYEEFLDENGEITDRKSVAWPIHRGYLFGRGEEKEKRRAA